MAWLWPQLALLLPIVGLAGMSATPSVSSNSSSANACPMHFSYVSSFYPQACDGSSSEPSSDCCLAAFNAFGLGLALHLRDYHLFELTDNGTLYWCYDAYQSSLSANGIRGFSVLDCEQFNNSTHFIRNPAHCGGIETAEDWKTKVGTTAMDLSCKGDLSSSAACQVCNVDALNAISIASSLSANNSDCFYFGVLYAAGIVNDFGPTNRATAACLLALEL